MQGTYHRWWNCWPFRSLVPDSKEEYWVALALYRLRIDFIFQRQVMGGRALRGGQVVDFWVYTTPKDVLRAMFRNDIKDPRCLTLIDKVIDSVDSGVPIGNYTSQWFSNYYLQGLDHFIKEKLNVEHYVRYVDDLVILGGNKRKLHRIRSEISAYLEGIHLTLKGDWQVFRADARAIDFVGFRFFRDKTILRKSNALRIRRRMQKIEKKDALNYKDACAVASYWGWVKRSNSRRFYSQYVRPIASVGRAKRRISEYSKAERLSGSA